MAPFLFSGAGLLAGVIAALSYLTLVYLVMTALQTIFVVELYRFASGGRGDGGFARNQLQNAFS